MLNLERRSMDLRRVVLLGFIFVGSVLFGCSAKPAIDNVPPRLLCSSADVAAAYKATKLCSMMEWRKENAAPPVNLALYYEYLCPGCRGFIQGQLWQAFNSIKEIMNLTLVPYGWAQEEKVGDHWKFTCQHGPAECVGNIIETCTINAVKGAMNAFPFIHCMESSDAAPDDAAKSCAKKFPEIPLDQIMTCANGTEGSDLEHQMALKTQAMEKTMIFVPWITINGKGDQKMQIEAQDHLVKLICDAYTGTKPPGCQTKISLEVCTRPK